MPTSPRSATIARVIRVGGLDLVKRSPGVAGNFAAVRRAPRAGGSGDPRSARRPHAHRAPAGGTLQAERGPPGPHGARCAPERDADGRRGWRTKARVIGRRRDSSLVKRSPGVAGSFAAARRAPRAGGSGDPRSARRPHAHRAPAGGTLQADRGRPCPEGMSLRQLRLARARIWRFSSSPFNDAGDRGVAIGRQQGPAGGE